MAVDGYLSKEMHDRFWGKLKGIGSNREVEAVIRSLKINILLIQEYQKELWESAQESYLSKQIVKTQRLIELENEMPSKFKESLSFKKGSKEYNGAVYRYTERMKQSTRNARLLLEAAATHQPMISAQGQVVDVDQGLIDTVLANLNASFMRLELLLNEKWSSLK